MKKLFTYAIALFLIAVLALQAQGQSTAFPKFQPVVEEDFDPELEYTFPDAPAVILYDFGETNFIASGYGTQRFISQKIRYYYMRRLMILKEPDPGTGKITITYNQDGKESLGDLKGFTYQLNAVGKVAAFKMNKRQVQYEKLADGSRRVSFELPLVKKGTIIEFRYSITSDNVDKMKDWEFQRRLPVLFSQYQTLIPERFKYTCTGRGDLSTLHKDTEYLNRSVRWDSRLNSFPAIELITYSMKNVPAIKPEPFMPVQKDVIAQLNFTRVEGKWGTRNLKSWEEFNQVLLSDRGLSVSNSLGKSVDKLLATATAKARGKREKAEAAYQFVRNKIEWTGEYAVLASGPAKALNQRKGSSADINLILLATAQRVGTESQSYPHLYPRKWQSSAPFPGAQSIQSHDRRR